MTTPVHDLIVTAADGTKYGYYVYVAAETPLGIDLTKPDIAANVITEAPGKQGGYYSVRDQDQPAIVYSDWSQGAGQKSYEVEDSYSSKFHSSSYIDTQMKGELRLARSVRQEASSRKCRRRLTCLCHASRRASSAVRLSPSMIRASRRGAEIDRKIVTTADGSVVDTIAPISKQAASGNALAHDRA